MNGPESITENKHGYFLQKIVRTKYQAMQPLSTSAHDVTPQPFRELVGKSLVFFASRKDREWNIWSLKQVSPKLELSPSLAVSGLILPSWKTRRRFRVAQGAFLSSDGKGGANYEGPGWFHSALWGPYRHLVLRPSTVPASVTVFPDAYSFFF